MSRDVAEMFQCFGDRRGPAGLPSPATVACRCYDVPYSRLQEHTFWRAAKLHTPLRNGPVLGNGVRPATLFLFKWNPDSVRPPVFPARIESLAGLLRGLERENSSVGGGFK